MTNLAGGWALIGTPCNDLRVSAVTPENRAYRYAPVSVLISDECVLASVAEHPPGVIVAEHAVGIEAVAHGGKALPLRIPFAQRGGGLVVALSPVRPPRILVHDLLDSAEVVLVFHADELVHRDVTGVAGVRS